jgi:uncharacterized membrane protein HdeD (DUF308 family)
VCKAARQALKPLPPYREFSVILILVAKQKGKWQMETEHIENIAPLPDVREPEEKIWRWLLGTGIFTIVLGIAAILLPFVATLTIEAFLALIFIMAGITSILHAFQSRQSKGLGLRLLAGVLYGLAGIVLLAFPLKGALTLTLLLAILFMIAGVFKIALALHLKPISSWGWLMFSGAVSALLGILIWMGLPDTAKWAIGFLVGIELLFSGWAMTMFALSIREDYKNQCA